MTFILLMFTIFTSALFFGLAFDKPMDEIGWENAARGA